MKSTLTENKTTWLAHKGKLIQVCDQSSNTIGFGTKRTLSITVFDAPMSESLKATELALISPNADAIKNQARNIFQTIDSAIKGLTDVIK